MTFANPGTDPLPAKASLSESEITLVIFSQWARFRSPGLLPLRQKPPAAGFPHPPPAQPVQPADPALLRNSGGFLPVSGRPVAGTALPLRNSSGVPTRDAKRRGRGWLADIASNRLGWYEGFQLSVNPQGVITGFKRQGSWPRISSPSGILPQVAHVCVVA